MSKILKYLFYLAIISVIAGPLGALPLGIPQVNIYITDIIIGLICLIWITKIKQAVEIIQSDSIAKYFSGFVVVAVFSLIFSPIHMNVGEKFIASLYLVRLAAYFFVYLTVIELKKRKLFSAANVIKLLVLIGLILGVFGWLQYFLYADLRNLYYLGWDPHFKRIFSTYLDPNYFGLVLILSLLAVVFEVKKRQKIWYAVKSFFIFVTLMFTYSRSSFLALITAVVYIFAVKKKYKFIGGFLVIIIASMLLLPRPGGVGVQLERVFSVETRVENWQQAFKIFISNPILGVGFNTTRFAKMQYNISQDNLSVNHAGAGFDNSFLFIAATTGLLGLLSFSLFARKVFESGNLWVKSSFLAIIVHSFFLNSLFFPWIMLLMWVMAGIARDSSTSSG